MSKKDKKEDGKKLTEKFNLRARPGQVIPYSQADKPLRKRMKKTMARINEEPMAPQSVETFGWRPVAKLERSLRRTQDLAERYAQVHDSLQEVMSGILFGKAANDGGAENRATFGQAAKESVAKLEELQDEARRIDRQRRDAAREIGIHIGASEKLEDKFNGKYVRKPLAKFAKSGKPKDKEKLIEILLRGEDLLDRRIELKVDRLAAKVLKEDMREVRFALRDDIAILGTLAKIEELSAEVGKKLQQSEQEWKGQLQKAAPAAAHKKAGPKA